MFTGHPSVKGDFNSKNCLLPAQEDEEEEDMDEGRDE